MKFDASKSKLHDQILNSAGAFMGLDTETMTETEIHAAFDGATPLAAQLDAAKAEATKDQAKEIETLKGEIETLKKAAPELETAKKDIETKDARITELLKEVEEVKAASNRAAAQAKTESSNLAAEIAKLKAGKDLESDEGGDKHDGAKKDGASGTTVVKVESDALKNLITPKN